MRLPPLVYRMPPLVIPLLILNQPVAADMDEYS